VGEVLQPQAAAPGDRRAVPCGQVLHDPEGAAGGDGARDPGERGGACAAGRGEEPVLHGRADGRPVGGDTG